MWPIVGAGIQNRSLGSGASVLSPLHRAARHHSQRKHSTVVAQMQCSGAPGSPSCSELHEGWSWQDWETESGAFVSQLDNRSAFRAPTMSKPLC
jgi:hypothetical protein